MLLTQTVEMLWDMKLTLTFDDGSVKEAVIKDGMYLLLKFRRNENTYIRAGRVMHVQPVLLDTQPISFTGLLEMDFSGKYKASRIKVAGYDILDFRIVTEEQIQNLAPDYIITENMLDPSYELPGSEPVGPTDPEKPVDPEPEEPTEDETASSVDNAKVDEAPVAE